MAIVFAHLRSFHAVAETLGFTAAAKALRISQPTVTTQVKELEDRYQVELLLRHGRKVALSDTGAALHAISRRLMSLYEEAEELLQTSGRLEGGQLRLAAVGPFHATEMLTRFLNRYPEVDVSVSLGNSHATLTRLLTLEADVAILATTIADPRIHSRRFSTHEVVAFVNTEHPWHERQEVSLTELVAESMILREKGSTTRSAFEAAAATAGLRPKLRLEIGSREGVWKAVEQGLGVGVVADFEFVAHPRLRCLRIADAAIRTEYHLACLAERQASPRIRAFMEMNAPAV